MDLGLKGKVSLSPGGVVELARQLPWRWPRKDATSPCAPGRRRIGQGSSRGLVQRVQVLVCTRDVTHAEDNKQFVAEVVQQFRRIDILVNNAGTGRLSDLMQLPEAEFRYNMDLMLYGPINCAGKSCPTCGSAAGAYHQHLVGLWQAAGWTAGL